MHIKREILSKIKSESFLIGVLHLIALLCLCNDNDKKRGHPYVYPTAVMLRCCVVRIWMRIPSVNALHYYLSIDDTHHRKVMRSCGLYNLPDRRTFDRRFKVLPIRKIISKMGNIFLLEGLVDGTTASVDSSLLKARGPVWHKSSMKKNTLPISGIDTDARWGFSMYRRWIFGYKLHISCSTGQLVVPLSADYTTANIADNQAYKSLVTPIAGFVQNIAGDPAYDDDKLYRFTDDACVARLVCPVRAYDSTPPERMELVEFYNSKEGQLIYGNRKISVEPLFECLKDMFGIGALPVRGFDRSASYVLSCTFVYQIAVYYNCITGAENPRCVRRMLGN
ncbi:MAG: transposase [Nitrosotalea sp.]